uniref:Uncharacterized protein n=1 Tax=Quercus lobata TaxID=97700 RepID=A0A7N2L083_QUELO
MNPARTIGPALASATYKGIWVYVVGPVIRTLLGAYTYNLIRESVISYLYGTTLSISCHEPCTPQLGAAKYNLGPKDARTMLQSPNMQV